MKILILLSLITTCAVAQLQVSANDHYLMEPGGAPVYLNGSAGWTLFVNVTFMEAKRYLDSCFTHGINFLEVMIVAKFGGPANVYGVNPWVGSQTFASMPNEPYFAHCDSIIAYAKTKGIYLHLYVDYLGYDGSQGFSGETNASTTAQMKAWGQYLGNRWKDSTNIVWAVGGDTNPSAYRAKLDSLVAGVKSTGDSHLISTRDEVETTGDSHWNSVTESWQTLNSYYSYHSDSQFGYANDCYNRTPAKPFILSETYYENESPLGHVTTQVELRSAMYWCTIWGGAGQVFGNCPVWGFDHAYPYSCNGHWYNNLNSQGHINAKWIGGLVRNRNWFNFIPDTSNQVLTGGMGSGTSYALCAYASDSTTMMVYMPSSRQVTVTSTKLKGDSTHAWWFNPADGTTIDLGIQSRASHNYTPASGDWVLVLDAKVMNYPPPGVDLSLTPPSPPLLATPANGATGVATNPTFAWNPSTGATSYRLQVSQDSSWGTTVINQSGIPTTSYHATGLANNTQYFWHVNATNTGGTSPFSPTWPFTTSLASPSLLFPTDGATNLPIVLTISWSQPIGATEYRVQLSLDSSFSSIVSDDSTVAETLREVGPLEHSTMYFWRVMARGLSGSSSWSEHRQFTTAPAAPDAPALFSPADASVNQLSTLVLSWHPSSSAAEYRLQVSPDSLFASQVIDDSTITDTTRRVTSLSDSLTYYWRVNARNVAGISPWSEPWMFTTALEATQQYQIAGAWNLISVPLTVFDSRKATLFPTSASDTFAFDPGTGYARADTLSSMPGYWLKFDSTQEINITGIPHPIDTINVETGWNLIGSAYGLVDMATIVTIPPGIRRSDFFEYAARYRIAATMLGGKGYWVKTAAPGIIILSSGSPTNHQSPKSTKPINLPSKQKH